MNKLITIILFVFCSFYVIAQKSDFQHLDFVYLKKGKVVKGVIIDRNQNGDLKLKMEDDSIISFESNQIKKVIQSEKISLLPSKRKKSSKNDFSRSKMYYRFALMASEGFGVEQVVGYQFNNFSALGVGVGFEDFLQYSGKDNIMSMFLELRGATKASKIAPTYSMLAGYGFAYERAKSNIQDKGGFMINPNIGIEFRRASKLKITFDIGMRIQAKTYRDLWANLPTSSDLGLPYTKDISRFGIVKLGVLF